MPPKVVFIPPPPMTQEEIDKVLADFHRAGWELWNSLPVEERLRINAAAEQEAQRDG